MISPKDFQAIRAAVASIPRDVSSDAIGANVPKLEDMFAPGTHAAALDPNTPIVVGSRGTGKSFWSGVLGQDDTRAAAAKAYPKLGLGSVLVQFGFTGISGEFGVSAEHLNSLVKKDAEDNDARAFWWATILLALERSVGNTQAKLRECVEAARDFEEREDRLLINEQRLRKSERVLLIVYDALDMVGATWPRRRLLTQALIEVAWAMRAYRAIKLKLFLRPDQLDDEKLHFVELPKLRTGAVRLTWATTDLYGLLYSRLALTKDEDSQLAFVKLLKGCGISRGDGDAILTRRWPLSHDISDQARVMKSLAGDYMASGPHGNKKGKTYDWPINHLCDAHKEVTPRSFLGLMIAAATFGATPVDRVITADGIRHGLRAASKTRVDQLHYEFPWIKGVLAPLAGILLPKDEKEVFSAWGRAKTIKALFEDSTVNKYLPPFSMPVKGEDENLERHLFLALDRIGVMFRRDDGRIDMPDLFRVAARLLKKGGIAPA